MLYYRKEVPKLAQNCISAKLIFFWGKSPDPQLGRVQPLPGPTSSLFWIFIPPAFNLTPTPLASALVTVRTAYCASQVVMFTLHYKGAANGTASRCCVSRPQRIALPDVVYSQWCETMRRRFQSETGSARVNLDLVPTRDWDLCYRPTLSSIFQSNTKIIWPSVIDGHSPS